MICWKRLAFQVFNGVTTCYYFAGSQRIEERDANTAPVNRYFFDGPGSDQIFLRVDTARGYLWYLHDGLGNTTHLVDTGGNVLERYLYDAWGTPSVYDAAGNLRAEGSLWDNRYLFKSGGGYEWFPQMGLYFCRARWYMPEFGRWLQPDPIGQAGGLNIYAYCENDPVNGVDPSGLLSWSDIGNFLSRALNAITGSNSGGSNDQNSSSASGSSGDSGLRRDKNGTLIAPRVTVTGRKDLNDYRIPLQPVEELIAENTYLRVVGVRLNINGLSDYRQLYGSNGMRAPEIDPIGLVTGGLAGNLVKGLARSAAKTATKTLYRAVMDAELADIEATNAFSNPPGIEVKYFATSAEDASAYAQQAYGQFGDTSAYTIVSTDAPSALAASFGTVDGGIQAVVVPSESLGQLGTPQILNFAPIH